MNTEFPHSHTNYDTTEIEAIHQNTPILHENLLRCSTLARNMTRIFLVGIGQSSSIELAFEG